MCKFFFVFTYLLLFLFEKKYFRQSYNSLGLRVGKTTFFQPHCHGQGHLSLDQVAHSPIQPGLQHFQGWGTHNFPSAPQLCQLCIPCASAASWPAWTLLAAVVPKPMQAETKGMQGRDCTHLSFSLSRGIG